MNQTDKQKTINEFIDLTDKVESVCVSGSTHEEKKKSLQALFEASNGKFKNITEDDLVCKS